MLVHIEPPISPSTAHAIALYCAGSYVGSLYLSRNARLSFKRESAPNLRDGQQRAKEHDERWRDDPDVIRARFIAAGTSTLSSCGVLLGLIWRPLGWHTHGFGAAIENTLHRLGLTLPSSISEIILPCLVTPVLFLGPIYAQYLAGALPGQRHWSWHWSVRPLIWTWQGWRNILFGPITEEIVFRACTIAVYHAAGASTTKMIFLTPLIFGLAHAHHAWEIFNRYGRTAAAAKRALLTITIQLSYTSLFGFHAAFLFLRTGSLLAPITAHMFCNLMGLPQIDAQIAAFPHRRRAIQFTYISGILGYVYTMRHWTLVNDSFYWPTAGAQRFY
ncbi:Abi-domain-containing protein [Wolfiporia cocos MD-104 SS10]|uniref:intramembrane prenyl-peptidase Rce1 n=1 Tax=Wolfiporia cocos (strain MD-104) TaxID=742152 RepID=A0A2H3IYV8_WOLCO|nr:Abi-domain-containing protein [Wolfiporia cocos MD-104 SS10]